MQPYELIVIGSGPGGQRAAINAVTELRDKGTCGYWDLAAVARPVIGDAFSR